MSKTLQTTVPPCMWATKEDWITNQGLITQLYEKQPLPIVMHLMETQYGFKATIKMYKTRIKQWGLTKKSQQHEIRAVAHQNKQRQRVTQGKRSTIHFHGRRLASTSSETMLKCFTAVPTLLTLPGILGISERIFNTIRDYHRGSFESGIWVSDQEGLDCWTVKAGPEGATINDPMKYMNALMIQCMLACRLFANNYCYDAGQALISATAGIKKILQAEHPITLILLFGLLLNVRRKNRQEIGLAILRQFSALAEVLLGDEHPLRQVCGWLASVDIVCFGEVVLRCLRSAGEHLETNLGPMHRSALRSRLRYDEEVYRHKAINQEELVQRKDLLYKCERILGTHDIRTLDIRLSLGLLYLKRKDYVKARKISQDTISDFHQIQQPFYQIQARAEGLFVLAISQYNLHETEAAETNLREAFSNLGTHESRVKLWFAFLEEWLSEHGHVSSFLWAEARTKVILEPVETD